MADEFDDEGVLCFASPYARPHDACRLACVSRRLRAAVHETWPARARAIGVSKCPQGLTWLDVVRDSLTETTGRDADHLMEGCFEWVESEWRERKLPAGATCSVGVFEGMFEDFRATSRSNRATFTTAA